jgi:hypothetical protein
MTDSQTPDDGFSDDRGGGREKRRFGRHPYGIEQRIAWVVDGQRPLPSAFQHFQCVDISRSGFAFYLPKEPISGELVVALGVEPNLIYFSAEVVHCHIDRTQGRPMYRVGCQFTGRVIDDPSEEEPMVNDAAAEEKRMKDLEAASLLLSGAFDADL